LEPVEVCREASVFWVRYIRIHHQKSVESSVFMKNAGVNLWLLSGLLGGKEDARFYLVVLTF